jgi:hypothetical protein
MQVITSMAPALCQHPPYWYPWCFYSTVVLWVVGVDGGELGLNDDKGRGEEFPARLAGDREQRRFVKCNMVREATKMRLDFLWGQGILEVKIKVARYNKQNQKFTQARGEFSLSRRRTDSGKQARGKTETAKFS